MDSQKNTATVKRYFAECLNQSGAPDPGQAVALLDELLAEDIVMYYNNQTDDAARHGVTQHKEFVLRHARGYIQANWMIETLLADGDFVACQWRLLAIHAPTGNPIDVRAADIYRLRGGRITELRRFLDFKSLGEQIEKPQRASASVGSPTG